MHLETDLQQDHEVKLRDASGPSADASSLITNDISGCQGVFKEVWRGAQAEVCQSTREPGWKSVAEDLMEWWIQITGGQSLQPSVKDDEGAVMVWDSISASDINGLILI